MKAKKADKAKTCAMENCASKAVAEEYCRLHYLATWKERKKLNKLKGEEKLDRYIQQLVKKFPDSHLEVLRKELSSTEDISTLIDNIEEGDEFDDFGVDIDEDTLKALRKIKGEE